MWTIMGINIKAKAFPAEKSGNAFFIISVLVFLFEYC